ncbi:atherin-like [Sorghum bicolor]|uniref:atherin-like n=1 Tax=Sorghum bicolor TaxID=4558 RepID=UPI000B4238FA|nr:atherin-like [Sorghum bicolor]|eukprot:XP_021301849.1 atherin-like [Sorghum bicolor]
MPYYCMSTLCFSLRLSAKDILRKNKIPLSPPVAQPDANPNTRGPTRRPTPLLPPPTPARRRSPRAATAVLLLPVRRRRRRRRPDPPAPPLSRPSPAPCATATAAPPRPRAPPPLLPWALAQPKGVGERTRPWMLRSLGQVLAEVTSSSSRVLVWILISICCRWLLFPLNLFDLIVAAHFRSDVGKFRYCVGYLVAAHFRSRFRWQITVVVTQIQMVQQELEGVIEESWRGNISVSRNFL